MRVCSVFEASGLGRGLRPVEGAAAPAEDTAGDGRNDGGQAPPEISDRMSCSACGCSFDSREEQTEHYRLDWHRFNLRQRLVGAQSVSAESFERMAGEISSISGSDSEESDSYTELEGLHCHDARDVSSPGSRESPGEEKPQCRRSTRVLFRSAEGEYLSVYRCVLQGKQTPGEDEDNDMLASLLSLNPETIWVILMTGGGHFAGAVFRGDAVIHHKTFHRYTVRAKRGIAQGARDGQNRSHAPKSAGASLRRYNEAALIKDIEDLLLSWTEFLQAASAIFLRAPSYNKGIFLGGKVPALNRGDNRLRSIPFSTRRATFREVKRVHTALSTVEIYAGDTDIATIHSPQRRVWTKPRKSAEDTLGSDECEDVVIEPADLPSTLEVVEETLGTLDLREFEVSPKKKRRKKKKKVTAEKVMEREGDDASPEIAQMTNAVSADPAIGPLSAGERNQGKKQQRIIGAFPAGTVGEGSEGYHVRDELYTVCRTGNVQRLRELLRDLLPPHVLEPGRSCPVHPSGPAADSRQGPEQTADSGSGPCGETAVVRGTPDEGGLRPGVVTADVLRESVDESGFTLLHVAAATAQTSILRLLLLAGCDPAHRDKRGRPAYAVSADRDTRNEFRRYMAEHPGQYNYARAQISAPLTGELEARKADKKRAQKAARKLREKERKEEERRLEEEEIEKKRFSALSEREKRALAAEKRFAQQLVSNGASHIIRRCWLCGTSLVGRVPFEYLDYSFCTTRCLQEHRRQQRL